ncbi:hypothetical protein ACHAWC_005839 [Mediolabrus comicus]
MKVGDFTVELVAADTKQPFTEHTAPDGQVYAEVEPDVDYFISLSRSVGLGAAKATIFVDGVNLGYNTGVTSNKVCKGSWERKDGRETMTALCFSKTRQEVGVTPSMLTGKVEVRFYGLGERYYDDTKNYKSPELTAESTLGGKKCIKSTTSGSQHSIPCTSSYGYAYKLGEYLCTITLNYCSALGLIYNKILPPPPALDESDESSPQRQRKKRKRSQTTTTTMISPDENNLNTVKTENSGVQGKVTVQLTYDLVDLTADD